MVFVLRNFLSNVLAVSVSFICKQHTHARTIQYELNITMLDISPYGVLASVTISHITIPNDHTSDAAGPVSTATTSYW